MKVRGALQLFTALIAVFSISTASATVAAVPGLGTWETTLKGRDLDGNAATVEAYYDTALNITWLANAAAFYGTWSEARTWASRLSLGGVTGWRLPDVKPVNGTSFTYNLGGFGESDYGYNVSSTQSELGHMYHVTLGGVPSYDRPPGEVIYNSGPFVNFDENPGYWTRVTYAPDTTKAWAFTPQDGRQHGFYQKESILLPVWAVHAGDVGMAVAVPEPSTWALMIAGLLATVGLARSKSRKG